MLATQRKVPAFVSRSSRIPPDSSPQRDECERNAGTFLCESSDCRKFDFDKFQIKTSYTPARNHYQNKLYRNEFF